jgi:hypothetical protein
MRLPSLIRLIVFIVIGAVPLAGQVQAQRPNIDVFLQQWDTDHDGLLSVDEIKKAAIARFERLDRKQKGRLSRSQLAGALTFQQFRKADKTRTAPLPKTSFCPSSRNCSKSLIRITMVRSTRKNSEALPV